MEIIAIECYLPSVFRIAAMNAFLLLLFTPSFLGLALTIPTPASAAPTGPVADLPRPALQVRATAYTHTEADHRRFGRLSAAGHRLRSGNPYHSAAADWSFLPLGTVFRIKGIDRLYMIDDYGSALVGTTTVDLYKTSKRDMNRWGARQVSIEILRFGSLEASLEILSGRTHYAHCATMHGAIVDRLRG